MQLSCRLLIAASSRCNVVKYVTAAASWTGKMGGAKGCNFLPPQISNREDYWCSKCQFYSNFSKMGFLTPILHFWTQDSDRKVFRQFRGIGHLPLFPRPRRHRVAKQRCWLHTFNKCWNNEWLQSRYPESRDWRRPNSEILGLQQCVK